MRRPVPVSRMKLEGTLARDALGDVQPRNGFGSPHPTAHDPGPPTNGCCERRSRTLRPKYRDFVNPLTNVRLRGVSKEWTEGK
jgi:hypothetical protein